MGKVPSQEWLERVNTEMANAGTAHRARPWRAWSLWAQETGSALDLEHPDVRLIFEWFAANTKTSAQVLGPMFLSVFYYDAEFWPRAIPACFWDRSIESRRITRFDAAPDQCANVRGQSRDDPILAGISGFH